MAVTKDAGKFASAIAQSLSGTSEGLAVGAGYFAANSATGIGVTDVVPNIFEAAMYGGFIFSPVKAAKTTWGALRGPIPGKDPAGIKYAGMLGYKTALLGIADKNPGFLARISLGNVTLSGVEAIGKFAQNMMGDAPNTFVSTMAHARKLGFAGMANIDSDLSDIKKIKHKWLYTLAGVKSDDASLMSIKGLKGQKTVKVTGAMRKSGMILTNANKMGRLATGAMGAYSLYSWLSVASTAGRVLGGIALEGAGEAARQFFEYTSELQKPEFGKGRVHLAMISSASATERQRAVRATYGAKINPTNRLYGTEASYHHSR
jgi:hypothetical protein